MTKGVIVGLTAAIAGLAVGIYMSKFVSVACFDAAPIFKYACGFVWR